MRRLFSVRDTKKYGKGVFAERDIIRGEVIHVLNGETLSMRDLVARVNSGNENIDDPLQVGKRTYIDLDSISRTFNHSCDPNAALRKRSELFAIKEILKGEEITFDYSSTIAPTEWRMKCGCGSAHCRGVLGDVLSIPKKDRTKYQKIGAFQTYMRKLLKMIERDGTYHIPTYELKALHALRTTSNV